MHFGGSSLINLAKSSSHNKKEEHVVHDKSQLFILDSAIQGHIDSRKYEVVILPSPSKPHSPEYYLFSSNRLYRIQAIAPSENPVSLFIDYHLTYNKNLLATFHFDAVFLFISILYLSPDKFMTMPSRIIDCYSNKSSSNANHSLQSAMLWLWAKDFNDVKKRLGYLCDSMESPGSNELLLRPNAKKLTHLLRFKVNNMVKCALERNLFLSEYCESTVTSSTECVRKHMVSMNEDKCRVYCWGILKSYLSESAAKVLVPSDIESSMKMTHKFDRKPQMVSTVKTQKPKQTPAGMNSITSFFKPKSAKS